MDIHAPHEPVRAWRDFAIHIAVVTVGILIALALEGLREVIRDHRLVAETRTNFRRELAVDREHADHELPRVRAISATVTQLAAQPGVDAREQLESERNPSYFFALSSWQTALSTGALQHMKPEEVEQYASANESIRAYTSLQAQALQAENAAFAFYAAHPQPTTAEQREGDERLMLYARVEASLVFVGAQLKQDVDLAYAAAGQ